MQRLLTTLEAIAATVLAAMSLLVIYQVFARYVLGSPPSWTEELSRYFQVWMVLLAAPVCLARGLHLAVDNVTPKLPRRPRRFIRRGVLILVAAFSLIVTWFGARLLATAALQVSPALGISMVWPYLALPVSGALLVLVAGDLLVSGDTLDRAEDPSP